MREHERYLRTFTYHFRLADKDNDGVLNEEQFKSLVGSLPITLTNEEVSYFLQVLDPFNTQKLTFSEIVQLFSSHKVSTNNEQQDEANEENKQNLHKVTIMEQLSLN